MQTHNIKEGNMFLSKWFSGICQMLEINAETNELTVKITRETGSHEETWNLEHTEYGFKRGDYLHI